MNMRSLIAIAWIYDRPRFKTGTFGPSRHERMIKPFFQALLKFIHGRLNRAQERGYRLVASAGEVGRRLKAAFRCFAWGIRFQRWVAPDFADKSGLECFSILVACWRRKVS